MDDDTEVHDLAAGPAEHVFNPVFSEQDADDEENDDFDDLEPAQDDPDDNGYFHSAEEENELKRTPSNEKHPKATDWKSVDPKEMMKVEVTVDKARQFLWNQAKAEIQMLREHWGHNDPSFDSITRQIFGEDGEVFRLFRKELDMDCVAFCRFPATFFTASEFRIPAERLHSIKRLDKSDLLKEGEWTNIINKMEAVDKDRQHGETFWMKLEKKFNEIMQEIFLSKRGDSDLIIALDDDKVHFNCSKDSRTHGLKRHRHVQDNRFGHTLHTAGFSAIGAMLCAVFEREQETSTDCCDRIVRTMFGASTGGSGPKLHGVAFCSDRGHWSAVLLFSMLPAWGADVVGTVKRCFWHPFSCVKGKASESAEDKFQRVAVSMDGCKDAFCKTHQCSEAQKLRATCYRPGTGTAISLAMSTIHDGPLFDLNPSFPKDQKDCFEEKHTQEERNKKSFPLVCGDPLQCAEIEQLPIKPLTQVQGDTCWFILRMFACASSTVDRMIAARAGETTLQHAERDTYETVLRAVGRTHSFPSEAMEEEEPNDDSSDEDNEEPNVCGVDFWARNWIRRVNSGEDAMFRMRMNDGSIDENVLRKIVEMHENSKPGATMTALRKQLEAWANLDHKLKRKCNWCTSEQLKTRIKEIDGTATTTRLKKPQPLDLLITVEEQQAADNVAISAGNDPFLSRVDPVMLQVFKSSFMKPLKEDAKKYCRKGHALERPFLEQFHDHSVKNLTGRFIARAIHQTPLVQSTLDFLPAACLDSSDAELVYSIRDDDDEICTMPVEMKARLSNTTFFAERCRMEANLGLAAFESGKPICIEIEAEEEDLWRWMPKHKESFQLLHHVAIRDVRRGLFLVGNSSKLIFGVFVNYSDDLIEAHQDMLASSFDRTLAPFYSPANALKLPRDEIERIIATQAMKPLKLSWHSFCTNYFIWRKLRLEPSADLKFPMPPCNRILPCNHSHWNNLKGASDAATKLFWNCQVKFGPRARSQAVCVGRLLQLFAVCIHRQNQVATAKEDLNRYGSLVHFRNSRNRCWPFHKTVDTLSEWFVNESKQCGEENGVAGTIVSVPTTPDRTERANSRRAYEEDRVYATICGGTPTQGRTKFPKNGSLQWQKHYERWIQCPGNLFRLTGKTRNQCFLCGSLTNFYCVGCKQHCCVVNRDEKVRKLVLDDTEVARFLEGRCPPASLNIQAAAEDGTKKDLVVVQNSCYHICHRKAVSERAATTRGRKPLTSVEEMENESMLRSPHCGPSPRFV